jgi:RimJ/RimL family protein N-acetyltransferase
MKWPTHEALATMISLPAGYRFEQVGHVHVAPVIAALKSWYPGISAGVSSCYLREDFYRHRVCLDDDPDKDIWVVRIMFGEELAGVWSFEREVDSLAIYGRILVVAPVHRGTRLSVHLLQGTESIGRAMGAAFIYALASLQNPYVQQALERAGFRLLGFFPGYDRAEVAPGVVKRVYQSVYAKLLVPEDQVHWPDPKNMTPRARALYELLFSQPDKAGASR